MATFISRSPEETIALGRTWGRRLQAGTVIGLSGELGAGKTQLVKGIAEGLGSKARVHSPTFALMNEYNDGRVPLIHIDLYRLSAPEEVLGAGLEDYLVRPAGITVVEWIERWNSSANAGGVLRVELEHLTQCERSITYDAAILDARG